MKKNMRPSGNTFFSSLAGGRDSFSLDRGPTGLADCSGFSSSDGAAASACMEANRAAGSAGRASRSAGADPPRKEQLAAVSAHSSTSSLIISHWSGRAGRGKDDEINGGKTCGTS